MSGYSLKARWGDELLDRGSTPIANLLLDYYAELDITTEECMFIIHVFRFKWGEPHPFPSMRTIAQKMGRTKRSIQGYASSLEEKEFLIRRERDGTTSELDFSPLLTAIKQRGVKNPSSPPVKDSSSPPMKNPSPVKINNIQKEPEEEEEPVLQPLVEDCQYSEEEVSKQVVTHYSEEADEKFYDSLEDPNELIGIRKIQEHWMVSTNFELLPARIAAYWLSAWPKGLWNHLEQHGQEKTVQLVTRAMDRAFEKHRRGKVDDLIGYLNAGIQGKKPYLIDD